MLRNLLRLSAAGKPIYGTPDIGLLASQIIAETATGDQGPGLLYVPALAHPTKQLRVKITSWSGTPGTLFVFENGSLLIDETQADGAYTIGYDWEAWAADGTPTVVSDTSPVQIGQISASAPGATVTGTGTISGGVSTGEQNSTAPGTTVTGIGSVVAGSADGQGNATSLGANVTGTSTVSGGTATGGTSGDAAAPGAIVNGNGTVVAGSVTGEQNATASGANVTGSGGISGGSATGDGLFSGSLSDVDIARIVAALPSAESFAAAVVMALRNATPLIPVNVNNIKGQAVAGSGTKADPWRPV